MSLTITTTEKKPGLFEVALDGRLDTDTSPDLELRLADLLSKPVSAVRFDMTKLNYVSSMGIRVMLKAFKSLKGKKAMFLMANLQPQIKKVFEIAAALPKDTIFANVAEADAYFDEMQRKALGEGSE